MNPVNIGLSEVPSTSTYETTDDQLMTCFLGFLDKNQLKIFPDKDKDFLESLRLNDFQHDVGDKEVSALSVFQQNSTQEKHSFTNVKSLQATRKTPNEQTLKAICELEKGEGVTYHSVDDMFKDIIGQ